MHFSEQDIQAMAMEAMKNFLQYTQEPLEVLNPSMVMLHSAITRANAKIGYQIPVHNLEHDISHPSVQATAEEFFNLSLERQTAVLFRIAGIDLLKETEKKEGDS